VDPITWLPDRTTVLAVDQAGAVCHWDAATVRKLGAWAGRKAETTQTNRLRPMPS
jgi:hypothetical protein